MTILFADLVGSTARAEALDPEDVRAILAPFYTRLRSELERFGGTVEKFIGDAAMAVFGAPVAHEDDPERAVRAALAIRDWALEDETIQVRIAVHTGEALVSLGARPLEGEGMVAGDVVNTAARLQSAAPVNGILVGEQTFRATERAIEYRDAEPVTAKGKAEPIAVWEVVQTRSRLGVDVARAHRTPLVGRGHELVVLRDVVERVLHEQTAQLLTLVGTPGIGKSRLVFETMQVIAERSELIVWRQGRSLPYGEGVSFWALAEIVKAQAGILDGDSPGETEVKLRLAAEAAAGEQAEWVLRHLRVLVGTADERGEPSSQVERFAAWRRFLEGIAEELPVVLVFEDLHWADDGLLDFVDHLVEWVSALPLLVIGTARPEFLERRPTWGGGKLNATTLALVASLRRGNRTTGQGATRPADPACGGSRGGRGTGWRQSALRGAIRADARRTRYRRRRSRARERSESHRGPSRRARAGSEAPAAGRRRSREGVLERSAGRAGRRRSMAVRASAPRARAEGARPAGAAELGGGLRGVLVPPRPGPRCGVRPDAPCDAQREASSCRAVARVSRPCGGARRDARSSLRHRARARARRRNCER